MDFMYPKRDLTTTSISISHALLEEAKTKAAQSFRTFSQYVSYLIHEDLHRTKAAPVPEESEQAKEVVAA